MELNIGDRVEISADETGDGVQQHGTIADIYELDLHTIIVDVEFDALDANGCSGITISNLSKMKIVS